MEEKDCIFCKIVREEIPATRIYEDEHVISFLDIKPNNLGHSLVVPKEHFPNIYTTPDEVLSRLIAATKKIAIAVKKGVAADGINIANNNEPAAGQLIFHTHVHVIPRYAHDGFKHWPAKTNFSQKEFKKTAQKIRKVLGG
ncbi:MAG: HIT family protein [Patescibacteria group bacterium]